MLLFHTTIAGFGQSFGNLIFIEKYQGLKSKVTELMLLALDLYKKGIEKSEKMVAKEMGKQTNNFNRSIKSGSMKVVDLAVILNKYGYNIEIRKKDIIEQAKDHIMIT